MQVLTAICPYCKQEVDSTLEQLSEPVVCPRCKKPFEIAMPTAVVKSVQEVDRVSADQERLALKPEERTLAKVHPVVIRARPFTALLLGLVFIAAIAALILSVTGTEVAGYSFGDTKQLGSASLLTWVCAVVLLIIAVVIATGVLKSQFTTLTVTSDRTIFQQGIISRDTSEVQHNDVRNIQLDQTFFQRLLGVGGIGISSSGQDDLEVVAEGISHPERLIKLIRDHQT